MPVTVVVGGQFGSEGKGKVAHFFAKHKKAKAVIRCGGVNSGHSIRDGKGKLHVFKQLPTASLINGMVSVLVPGSYIDLKTLQEEIAIAEIHGSSLVIDPKAVVMTEEQASKEVHSSRCNMIGSTGFGVAEALLDRISRNGKIRFANDIKELMPYIKDSSEYLRCLLDDGEQVILEGTQGFGLSLLHSDYYPFVTSRDTTASGFISESGLSPFDVDDIVLVLRSYPIRVGGNSGPMKSEIDWKEVTTRSGSPFKIEEFTTVTRRIRRVSEFDSTVAIKAIAANQPTLIVLNHLDYIPSLKRVEFVTEIENRLKRKIDFFGFDDKSLFVDYQESQSNIIGT